ncbi:unnamed protein product, partial [Closterium sp. NIES-53]
MIATSLSPSFLSSSPPIPSFPSFPSIPSFPSFPSIPSSLSFPSIPSFPSPPFPSSCQVAWLKEQLVFTLESHHESQTRVEALQTAMVEMAQRDTHMQLTVKVEQMTNEVEVLRRELSQQQQRAAVVLEQAVMDKQ